MLNSILRASFIRPSQRSERVSARFRLVTVAGLIPVLMGCSSVLPPTPTSPPASLTSVVAIPTVIVAIPTLAVPPTSTVLPTAGPASPTIQPTGVVASAHGTATPIAKPTSVAVPSEPAGPVDDEAEGVVRAFVAALAANDRAALLQLTTSRGSRFIPADAADLVGAIDVRTMRTVGAATTTRREVLVALTVRLPNERVNSWTNGNNARFIELTRAAGQNWRINEIALSPIGSAETMGPPPVPTPGRG